jgi:uncharacterized protein YndB with AHSA1/START domain
MRTFLRMRKLLPAAPAEVFRAMTDERELVRWWGPQGFTVPRLDIDPRPGGGYVIEMQPPQGDPFRLSGEFLKVERPGRLVYTFRWDPPDPDDRETVVTLSLQEQGNGTEVELTHGEFTAEERQALHEGGWADSFGRLAELLG